MTKTFNKLVTCLTQLNWAEYGLDKQLVDIVKIFYWKYYQKNW